MFNKRKHNKFSEVQAATPENLRIQIDAIFKNFMDDPEALYYDFPSDLNNLQRKYIHEKARKLNIHSKSHGKEPNRTLTISKKKSNVNFEGFYLNLSPLSSGAIDKLCNNGRGVSNQTKAPSFKCAQSAEKFSVGKLTAGYPVNVRGANPNPLLSFRKTLPIYQHQSSIVKKITENNVVIVSSETGSGKTTQIPQFILEEAHKNNDKCKIICTQPRRISAVSVAERVAAERGEQIGQTVGYHIRLESKFSSQSALIFCTNGVLLRALMNGLDYLQNVTHVIVDEIHERDKFSDFLLICLRDCLSKFPHLRVILMSATMQTEMFEKYFACTVTCTIPGRLFPITELFLEDILHAINYESYKMRHVRKSREQMGQHDLFYVQRQKTTNQDVDEEFLDQIIVSCCSTGSDEAFDQFMQQICENQALVNYQHSESGLTGLMAAAMHGRKETVEKLINLSSNINLTCNKGWTALNWAQYYSKQNIVDFLNLIYHNQEYYERAKYLLDDYDQTIRDDIIDFELIVAIIESICKKDVWGSILVFLPGYDDIMLCQEEIHNSKINQAEIVIFTLHGGMQVHAQNEVFKPIPNRRKIILATNVAETSITVDDVVFVIDTGKAKEKKYDAFSGICSLETTWISQACVKQRAGRAGRTRDGICFHIFSKTRYKFMQPYRQAEILRVPLQELCLHTKMLAPRNVSISKFLAGAIEPPSLISIQSAIHSLQALHALDLNECLTPLGQHLVQLSIEPHLGKMLIYAAIFRCLDPVLTIVSCLAHKDPYTLPAQHRLKGDANSKRKYLTKDSLSDHMSYLSAFQMWQSSRDRVGFCRKYYISNATMEMILQTRSQLLTQLRMVGFIMPHIPNHMFNLNTNSHCWPFVKAVLAAGLYPNIAYVRNNNIFTKTEKNIVMHGTSCLFKYIDDKNKNSLHQWFIYEELSKAGKNCVAKCATVINPVTIALMCGDAKMIECDGSIMIDDWLEFEPSNKHLYDLRQKIEHVISKKINNPAVNLNNFEMSILETLRVVLTCEDETCKLKSPEGVGQRPKFHEKSLQNENDDRKFFKNNSYGGKPNNNPFGDHRSTLMPSIENNFCLTGNEVFFIVKPLEEYHLNMCIVNGSWTFPYKMQNRILQLFTEGKQILLVFSIEGSKTIQGIAQVIGGPNVQNRWNVKWVKFGRLFYKNIRHLFCENQNIYKSKDYQEIEPRTGLIIYSMFKDTVPENRRILVHINRNS